MGSGPPTPRIPAALPHPPEYIPMPISTASIHPLPTTYTLPLPHHPSPNTSNQTDEAPTPTAPPQALQPVPDPETPLSTPPTPPKAPESTPHASRAALASLRASSQHWVTAARHAVENGWVLKRPEREALRELGQLLALLQASPPEIYTSPAFRLCLRSLAHVTSLYNATRWPLASGTVVTTTRTSPTAANSSGETSTTTTTVTIDTRYSVEHDFRNPANPLMARILKKTVLPQDIRQKGDPAFTDESKALGCWLWQGSRAGSSKNPNAGTPVVSINYRTVPIRQIMWETYFGPIPPRQAAYVQFRRICDTASCIHPLHTYALLHDRRISGQRYKTFIASLGGREALGQTLRQQSEALADPDILKALEAYAHEWEEEPQVTHIPVMQRGHPCATPDCTTLAGAAYTYCTPCRKANNPKKLKGRAAVIRKLDPNAGVPPPIPQPGIDIDAIFEQAGVRFDADDEEDVLDLGIRA